MAEEEPKVPWAISMMAMKAVPEVEAMKSRKRALDDPYLEEPSPTATEDVAVCVTSHQPSSQLRRTATLPDPCKVSATLVHSRLEPPHVLT